MLVTLLLLTACDKETPSDSEEPRDFTCPEGTVWLGHECGEPEVDSEPDGVDSEPNPDDTGPDSGDLEPCRAAIDETYPQDGSTSVFYRSSVEFHLSQEDLSAEISVRNMAGSSQVEGNVVIFQPLEPFEPSTNYRAELTFCEGRRTAHVFFTTSSTGAAVDPSGLTGTTWNMDTHSGRVAVPAGVGAVLESYLEGGLLLKVLSADAGALALRLASADERGEQAECPGTADLVADFSANPYFSFGPQDTTLHIGGISMTFGDMRFSGAVTPDGSGLEGVSIGGSVDTRPLVDLVEEGGDDDAICQLVAGFGVSCVPCASDGEVLCIDTLLVDAAGEEVSAEVAEVPGECAESCQDEDGQCQDTGCATAGRRGGAWLALVTLLGLAARRRAPAGLSL